MPGISSETQDRADEEHADTTRMKLILTRPKYSSFALVSVVLRHGKRPTTCCLLCVPCKSSIGTTRNSETAWASRQLPPADDTCAGRMYALTGNFEAFLQALGGRIHLPLPGGFWVVSFLIAPLGQLSPSARQFWPIICYSRSRAFSSGT